MHKWAGFVGERPDVIQPCILITDSTPGKDPELGLFLPSISIYPREKSVPSMGWNPTIAGIVGPGRGVVPAL